MLCKHTHTHTHTCVCVCISAAKIFVVTSTRTVWCYLARDETRHLFRQKSRTAKVPKRTVTMETESLYWRVGLSFSCASTYVSSFGHFHDMVSTADDKLIYLQWDTIMIKGPWTLELSVFHTLALKNVYTNNCKKKLWKRKPLDVTLGLL